MICRCTTKHHLSDMGEYFTAVFDRFSIWENGTGYKTSRSTQWAHSPDPKRKMYLYRKDTDSGGKYLEFEGFAS